MYAYMSICTPSPPWWLEPISTKPWMNIITHTAIINIFIIKKKNLVNKILLDTFFILYHLVPFECNVMFFTCFGYMCHTQCMLTIHNLMVTKILIPNGILFKSPLNMKWIIWNSATSLVFASISLPLPL